MSCAQTSAFAADAGSAGAQQASTVQEVTVTARKKSENLQTIPEAVSSLSSAQLTQQGIRSPSDLQRSVPSLSIQGNSVTTSTGMIVSIRGQVASDYLLTLSQPVGLYEDAVNIPHPAGTDLALFDLDHIEVLKGPQGTLYGRNTTGGAINLITRGANYNGLHGYLLGEVGDYADWKAAGAVNVPLIPDVLAARVAYQRWSRDGYGHSALTGQKLGDSRDDDVVRGSLRFDPLSNLTSQLKVEYFHAVRTDNLYQTRELFDPATADTEWALEGSPGGVAPSVLQTRRDLFTNYSSTKNFDRVKGWHVAVDATWRIDDDLSLRSISGLHQFTDFQVTDLGGNAVQNFGEGLASNGKPYVVAPETRPLLPDQESLQWTQEFDLLGNAFSNHLKWLVGGFYSSDVGNEDQTASVYPEELNAMGPLGPFDVSFFDPKVTSRSWAFFTQNDFKFNDVFSITAGLRYTEELIGSHSSFALHLLTPGNPTPFFCQAGPLLNTFQASQSNCLVGESVLFSGTSYLLSFNFQLTRSTLLYVKTARGFRGGALQERAPGLAPARPEIATDYEVGLKTTVLDGRLRANLAGFQTNYMNKQETAVVGLPSGAVFTPIVNAATARIRGFEAELTAIPVSGLTLNANVGYLDGVYLSYPQALTPWNTIVDGSGAAFGDPHWTVDVGGRYVIPVGPGELGVAANYAWTSQIPTTILNDDPSLLTSLQHEWRTSIGLLNATVDYRIPDQGLTLSLFSTNLTNEHYQRQGLTFASPPNPYGYTGITQAPRMYGFSVRKSFGPGE